MLNPKQRQYLKGLAHSLNPTVLVGEAGVSDAVLAELDRALAHHELLKVRLPALEREEREHMAEEMAARVSAETVQRIGRIVVLYRPGEKQRIVLPK
ncbi:ribosome assembly RNA-binding protein YhbY [Thermithiobacillus tepidarius DSM 3134]|uniref:ribosome assembly RNA-binding protein YhbY n=1 Tax=Thermithiobacillus tepidarius TaxID=929 RepID=UPI0003FF0B35|nr:ribosome assembly RNA-binding protein YhbY [Thermithiobacillus tepidarius]